MKVLIFGDRDVDGITSTSLLHRALTDIGIDTEWRVPSGNDPYGLTIAAVETHAENSGTLIITVDNGISCRDAVARANELGIDVVVLDHHNPPDVLPDAVAIINPKMEDSGYPFRDLAGCAVVWKFITALRFARTELYKQQICLLNVRPANESYLIEAIKVVNMTEQTRISETVVPGMVSIRCAARTLLRISRFCVGRTASAEAARNYLRQGEIHFHDRAGNIAQHSGNPEHEPTASQGFFTHRPIPGQTDQ